MFRWCSGQEGNIYIYICICCRVKIGLRFGVSCVKIGPSLVFKIGPSFSFTVFPIFIVFGGMFKNTHSVTLCQNSVCAKFWGCQKWGFWKENCIFVLCWINRNRKNGKAKRKPIKAVFLRWSSKNVKNGFLAKIAWHYLCQEGRKTRIFVHTICFGQNVFLGPKQCKPGNTIKIVVSMEIAQNQKWHLSF